MLPTSKGILNTFTEIDFIFLIMLALLIYFPFYMNDKRYQALYLIAGILTAVYNIFLRNKLLTQFASDTIIVNAIYILVLCVAGVLVVFGIIMSFSVFLDLIFGSDRKNKK
jgi:hypothetical protein